MTDSRLITGARALRRWRNAVCAAYGVSGIVLSSWGPRMPAVKAQLGVDTATIGILLACFAVGTIGGLLVAPPVLHRIRARRALGAAIVLASLALSSLGIALVIGSAGLALAALIAVGVGNGVLGVVANVEGAAVERIAGRAILPLVHGSWSVGAAAGAGIGAVCAAWGIAPSAQFVGEAVVVAASAFLILPAIRQAARTEEHASVPVMRWHNVAERVRGCLQWRLLLIGLIMLAAELGEGAANNWMALAVHSDHGQSAAMAALFFAAFAVGQAVARLLGGPVVDRLGRVAAVRWTSAIGVIGVAMFILCIDPWLVLLGSVLWAVGVSMGFPLGTSAAADSGPAPAVRVASASSIAYVANLAGPAVIGVLAESVGLLHSLWLIALALAASFVVAGVLRPRRPDPEERSRRVSSVPS